MKTLTRRQILSSATLIAPALATSSNLFAQNQFTLDGVMHPYRQEWLPDGVRSRFVNNVNGLRVHVLEAGFETPNRPALLLLHGFPELAYSWRNVMKPLADAGYHVFAPDVRGYGRTTGWDSNYDGDLTLSLIHI